MPEPAGRDLERYERRIKRAIELGSRGIDLGSRKDLAQAVRLLSRLASEFSKAASAHGYLGWYLLHLGRYQDALKHSARAIRLSPKSEYASLVHFFVLWDSGKRIKALDEMKRFLKIRPSTFYTDILKDWKPPLTDDE